MYRYTWRTGILETVMILVGIIFLFPVYMLVNLALKAPGDQSPALLPALQPTLTNFVTAWDQGGFGSALLNSVIVTVTVVGLTIVLASAAAYPLSRLGSRWSRFTFVGFLAGLLLPVQLALLPLYQSIRDLGLLGTLPGVIIVYVGGGMPFAIFLYASFMRAIPADYEEAAALDGAHAFQTFWAVMFPLVRPITGTVAILTAVGTWNDFLIPLLYLSGTDRQTMTVAIYGFVGQYGSDWNLIFAGIIISVLPVLIAYFFMQKYIVQGFAGGLKG